MKSFLLCHNRIIGVKAVCIFLFLLFWAFNAQAQTCEFTNQSELMEKIKLNHPLLKTRDERKSVLKAGVDQASQVPNPQLNLTSNHGGETGFETTGSLQYVFELGRKQSSRINLAESQQRLGEIQISNSSDQVLIDTTLKLMRYGQIQSLYSMYKESLEVFKKMRSSIRKNKNLSPEQKVQEDMVDMEVSKHQLKISQLKSELSLLENLLQFYAGEACLLNIKDLSYQFPDPSSINITSGQLPDLKELEWQSKLTGAKLSLEQSAAYPDIKIGPSFQTERNNGQGFDRFGLALTMDLPVLNRNQGGKALAIQQKKLIDARLHLLKTESDVLLESLLEKYRNAILTLKEVPKKNELLEKHHRIENFFLRGMITISTMIDSHDSLLNLVEERNQHELLALETYLKIKQSKNELDLALKSWGNQ